MKFCINTMDDFNVEGKTVLIRVDMNQPIDKKNKCLKSIHRIEACAPTIKELAERKAKIVIMCHQGSDIEYQNFYCTKLHAQILEKLIENKVNWIKDVCGPAAKNKIKNLNNGEILLLDNVRYQSEEMTLFEKSLKLSHEEQANTQIVRELAPLADIYINDAFAAAHRDQPTLCGFQQLLPSAMGRLFEKEYVVISKLMKSPKRPCIYVLGGAKIADAFIMLDTVLKNGSADKVLTGGLVGNIILIAMGKKIGNKSITFIENSGYSEYVNTAKELIGKYNNKIIAPVDLGYVVNNKRYVTNIEDTPDNISAIDIGHKTFEMYSDIINDAKTVFVNGPMGIFEQEPSEDGTKAIFNALASTSAYTVVGGGDSVAAAKKYNVTKKLDYICTGGGALIRFLTGEELPAVKALKFSANKFGNDN